jgi:hypothetical protein
MEVQGLTRDPDAYATRTNGSMREAGGLSAAAGLCVCVYHIFFVCVSKGEDVSVWMNGFASL